MGLFEDLTNDKSFGRRQSLYCTVCQLIDSLEPKERKLLTDRLDDKSIATAGIVRVLDKNGHSISAAVLSRHRRKECKRES